ncbi:MAG: hypothetical protein E7354_03735 [Clostridiales bacterium]|nr:hypothetical protein [Clostridiales bacterium]
MSRLGGIKEKERFLSAIEGVDQSVISLTKDNTEKLDLYTYFITLGAHNTGAIEDKELYEFLLSRYADWFCINQNNTNTAVYKITHGVFYSPSNMTGRECFDYIRSGKFSAVLPIEFQYINRLEEKFFVSIDVNKLYNQKVKNDTVARLYINLPSNKVIPFVREFIDRAYLSEFPATIKFLNTDDRCDTVIIYTDYASAGQVVKEIESIREDYPSRFEGVGGVNPLLARVNDYIGFGEKPTKGDTYFKSRTDALSAIEGSAITSVLKDNIIAKEQAVVFRADGRSYTPTEYLMFLVEKVAISLIEDKICEMEEDSKADRGELFRLYKLRESVEKEIEIAEEVKKLKKCLTRNGEYQLSLSDIGVSDFDFVSKLYKLFTTEEDRLLKRRNIEEKKKKISSVLFRTNDELDGVNIQEFLQEYFRLEVATVLQEIIDDKMGELKETKQSSVLSNLKQKQILRLRTILKNILNDSDDGREYLDRCVSDYVRILSTDAAERVEVYIDDVKVELDSNVNEEIVNLLPSLQSSVDSLTIEGWFIDKTLQDYGINKDNLSINVTTKNLARERVVEEKKEEREFYYKPSEHQMVR